MPEIGPLEILVVGAIALIVFGPQKLPEMARSAARWMGQLRRMASDVRAEFEAELSIPEDDRVRDEDERPEPVRLGPDPARVDASAEADKADDA